MNTKTKRNHANTSGRNSHRKFHNKGAAGRSGQRSGGKTLHDLLEDGLHDMYSAETLLLDALGKLARAAYHEDLQDAFEFHFRQTQRQVERLEKVFSRLHIAKKEDHICEAMKGLISEAEQIIKDYPESPVRDSALIIAAQKVEHYEIASYGSLCELSDVLGYWNIHDILGRTLDEEEITDHDLSELAVFVNDEAMALTEELEQESEERES